MKYRTYSVLVLLLFVRRNTNICSPFRTICLSDNQGIFFYFSLRFAMYQFDGFFFAPLDICANMFWLNKSRWWYEIFSPLTFFFFIHNVTEAWVLFHFLTNETDFRAKIGVPLFIFLLVKSVTMAYCFA